MSGAPLILAEELVVVATAVLLAVLVVVVVVVAVVAVAVAFDSFEVLASFESCWQSRWPFSCSDSLVDWQFTLLALFVFATAVAVGFSLSWRDDDDDGGDEEEEEEEEDANQLRQLDWGCSLVVLELNR